MRDIPSYNNFLEFLREYQDMVILAMHSQADPDAVGSAIALTHFIRVINPNLIIRTLEPELSALGQKLLDITNFKFDSIRINQVSPPFLCIFLDTNYIDSRLFASKNQFVIIDHHTRSTSEVEIAYDFQLDNFRATAEIIASLYYHAKISLTPKVIKGLLAGIVFDTRRFLYADRELFDCVNYLLCDNSDVYFETMKLFSSSRSYSEKLACIKSAQRMRRHQINGKILLFSHVGSFEAAAARSLILLGGDIAIVIANRKKETRISFRTSLGFPKETDISLGKEIIPMLINQFGGTGGGHDSAAGYNSTLLEIESVKKYLFQLFEKLLKEKNQK
ncbi:MAG: DHH family phosphoesterase [Candidatus Hodarchaeales archaeon]